MRNLKIRKISNVLLVIIVAVLFISHQKVTEDDYVICDGDMINLIDNINMERAREYILLIDKRSD